MGGARRRFLGLLFKASRGQGPRVFLFFPLGDWFMKEVYICG